MDSAALSLLGAFILSIIGLFVFIRSMRQGLLVESPKAASFLAEVTKTGGGVAPHLVVPYTLDCNDMRFALPQGFSHGDEFFESLRDAFDVHYAEGDERPSMTSVGMHCRLLGRAGRMRTLQRFLDHIDKHDRVWVTRRIDIARHWKSVHPFNANTAFAWE